MFLVPRTSFVIIAIPDTDTHRCVIATLCRQSEALRPHSPRGPTATCIRSPCLTKSVSYSTRCPPNHCGAIVSNSATSPGTSVRSRGPSTRLTELAAQRTQPLEASWAPVFGFSTYLAGLTAYSRGWRAARDSAGSGSCRAARLNEHVFEWSVEMDGEAVRRCSASS